MNDYGKRVWMIVSSTDQSAPDFTFGEACEYAKEDSTGNDDIIRVYHRDENTPRALFWDGKRYQLAAEDVE